MKSTLVRSFSFLLPWFAWSVATGVRADSLAQRWAIAPEERPYVTTGNLERGIALNPATGNVLLAGRSGSPKVYVLKLTPDHRITV